MMRAPILACLLTLATPAAQKIERGFDEERGLGYAAVRADRCEEALVHFPGCLSIRPRDQDTTPECY